MSTGNGQLAHPNNRPSSKKTSVFQSVRQQISKSERSKKMFVLLAETFQALGDTSRIQIVWALSHGELCVGDIAELLSMSQPAVSHHLRTLRNLKLVRVRRDGRTSFYSLDDDHIERLLHEGIEHVEDLLT
jgi:ArsR family transcriptional regulator, lead/cadmium/zinc/bismuth-responsive transcriptional repressor